MDRKRYLALLEKERNLTEKGDFSFYQTKEDHELSSYRIIFQSQMHYNRKKEYFSLIENYMMSIIDISQFQFIFFQLWSENNRNLYILEKDFQRLSTFPIDSKSKEFADLTRRIFENCEGVVFEDDYDLDDPEDRRNFEYGITEKQFRDWMEEIFFRIQKYLDE